MVSFERLSSLGPVVSVLVSSVSIKISWLSILSSVVLLEFCFSVKFVINFCLWFFLRKVSDLQELSFVLSSIEFFESFLWVLESVEAHLCFSQRSLELVLFELAFDQSAFLGKELEKIHLCGFEIHSRDQEGLRGLHSLAFKRWTY